MAESGKLLVIGGLAAGLSAAGAARRLDPRLEITVLEAGDEISYGICGLPYLISGEISKPENLKFHTPDSLFKERAIRILTRHRAVEIREAERTVITYAQEASESRGFRFDRLVIATGAQARVPLEVPERTEGIFALRTLRDALAIGSFLEEKRPAQAVVVGAGVLGLELADVLTARGIKVALLEQASLPAPSFDAAISERVLTHLKTNGVQFFGGEMPETATADLNGTVGAINSRTQEFPCGMVAIATGITPRVELAAKAGIRLDKSGAIEVDECMETNARGIYAAGDCATAHHAITGRPYYLPTATVAVKGGRVAGANAAGIYQTFPGALGTQAISLLGWELARTGLSAAEAKQLRYSPVSETITAQGNAEYMGRENHMAVTLIADAGTKRLIGAQLFGPRGATLRLGALAAAITAGMTPKDLAGLDLPYAPHVSTAWDPIIIAARKLDKEIG